MKPTIEPEPAALVRRKVGTRNVAQVVADSAPVDSAADSHYFHNYAEYSKTLRAWLVAYGIGGPILFLTNKDLTAALSESPEKQQIISLFLIGVSSQVFLAFINKWCAWYVYAGENDRGYRSKRSYKVWAWLNDQSWLDLLIDILSLSAFAYSTWLTVSIFV